jgi:hypothetical protein
MHFGSKSGEKDAFEIILRFGQLSADEFFVGESAARAVVTITNRSLWEPMVILKQFGPNHTNMPAVVQD